MFGIENSTILNFNPFKVEENTDLIIDGNKIIDKGKNIINKYPECKVIGKNKVITTGIVCSHSHIYSALARGLDIELKKSKDFVQILENLWWILDKALNKDMVEVSAQVCAIEAILNGVTTIVDHHSSPNFIEGSLNTIKNSFEKIGLRSILCYETTDRNGQEKIEEAILENENFANMIEKEKKDKCHNLTEASIGAHAPFTLSDNTLKELSRICGKTNRGLHIHVSEDRFDPVFNRFYYANDPIKRLEKFNLLNEKSIIVHGVHIDPDEIEIINKNNSILVHNPRSNMNNSVGYNNLLHNYDIVAIGTDGINHDVISELATAYYKNRDEKLSITMQEFLKMLDNGNIILNRYFEQKFGKIEKDCIADLVLWDYNSPTEFIDSNIAGHFIFGFNSGYVNTVIINGNIVLKDRKFNFDIESIFENARFQGKKLVENMKKIIDSK